MYCCYDLYVDTSRELEQKTNQIQEDSCRFILPPPSTIDVFLLSWCNNIYELSLMCMSLRKPTATGVAVLLAYEASAGKWDLDRIIRGAHHLGPCPRPATLYGLINKWWHVCAAALHWYHVRVAFWGAVAIEMERTQRSLLARRDSLSLCRNMVCHFCDELVYQVLPYSLVPVLLASSAKIGSITLTSFVLSVSDISLDRHTYLLIII